jgi:TolB-like protein
MWSVETEAQAAQAQLECLLQSDLFARSGQLSRLLQFLVQRHLQGRDQELKESVIGVEVFGRQADYDSKRDPIVRTEARRLRARLAEYYRGAGKSNALIIELPKGGYVPVFRSTETAAPSSRPRTRLWVSWGRLAAAGAAVALAAVGWTWFEKQNTSIPIAVLPLVSVSQDSGAEYYADGLTSELISKLSIIEGLTVRSQTSSFAFKGKPRSVSEAGAQLHVDYVLEGSVQRDGNRLRILAELVRARDDQPVWSGRYDRDIADVFAIQDEISFGIVNSLRLKLSAGRRRYETSTEAYDFYLRARALERQVAFSGGYERSIPLFEQAVAKDASFAPAWAGLAAAHAWRAGMFKADIADELVKMRATAEKAIQLDPLLPEAYDALGTVDSRDAQWEQSEKSFRRAIELDRNRSMSVVDFTIYVLWPLGRVEEALQQLRTAERADPLSFEVRFWMGSVLISARRYKEAEGRCQNLPADFSYRSSCVVWALLGEGRAAEAIQTAERAPRGQFVQTPLACAYARAGRREEAEKQAQAIRQPLNQAEIFACLGDKDRTLDALDRAAVAGPFRIGRDLNDAEFDFLRGDPLLKALRKKVGLPERHL